MKNGFKMVYEINWQILTDLFNEESKEIKLSLAEPIVFVIKGNEQQKVDPTLTVFPVKQQKSLKYYSEIKN